MFRSSEKLNSGSQGGWEPAANQAETHFREVRPRFCLHWLSLLQFLTPLLLKWQLQQEDLEVKRLGNVVRIPKISPELCHVILGHNRLKGFPPPANSCLHVHVKKNKNKQKTASYCNTSVLTVCSVLMFNHCSTSAVYWEELSTKQQECFH